MCENRNTKTDVNPNSIVNIVRILITEFVEYLSALFAGGIKQSTTQE